MKHSAKKLFCKSFLRQPVYSVLLCLLLAAVSFGFASQLMELGVILRETDRISGYYRAIGTLTANEEGADLTAGADLIAQSSYVAMEDRVVACAGILDGLYNANVDGRFGELGIGQVWFYGILSEAPVSSDAVETGKNMPGQKKTSKGSSYTGSTAYVIRMTVDEVLSGYPEYVPEGNEITMYYLPDAPGDYSVLDELEAGKRYLVRAVFDPSAGLFTSNTWQAAPAQLLMKPLYDGIWYLPVEKGTEPDWTQTELAAVREEIDILFQNQHAMSVIGTKNMSAMPDTQQESQRYYLTQGRWLTLEDYQEERKVCVVHSQFAQMRGLSVGDSITVTLRDMAEALSVIGEDLKESWRELPVKEETFEIVGIYDRLLSIPGQITLTYYNLAMYVPFSCIPESFETARQDCVASYSFVLSSTRNKDAFLQENRDALRKLGYEVSFIEDHSDSFWESALPLRQSLVFGAGLFGTVFLMGTAIAVFAYLHRYKREFAVLRAMGIPDRVAAGSMKLPIVGTGCFSLSVGIVAAWIYARGKSAELMASVAGSEQITVSSEISFLWPLLCGCGMLLILYGMTAAGMVSFRNMPVLLLLHRGGGEKNKGQRKAEVSGGREDSGKASDEAGAAAGRTFSEEGIGLTALSAPAFEKKRKKNILLFSCRYMLRGIVRSLLKSSLIAALACAFLVTLMWMQHAIHKGNEEIDRLYETTQIEMQIMKRNASVFVGKTGSIISEHVVDDILKSGLVSEAYLESGLHFSKLFALKDETDRNEGSLQDIKLYAASEIGGLFKDADVIPITYAEGWDEGLFKEDWILEKNNSELPVPAVLPEGVLEELGIGLGDFLTVREESEAGAVNVELIAAGTYKGTVSTPGDGAYTVLVPLSALKGMCQSINRYFYYSTAEFKIEPTKNHELYADRSRLQELVEADDAGLLGLRLVIWDEELIQVVAPLESNIRLMRLLYPVTAALSVLIAVGAAVLFLVLQEREAAILRILGCTCTRTRLLLCLPLQLLCVCGLMLGFLVGFLLESYLGNVIGWSTVLCALLLLLGNGAGCLFASGKLMGHRPLELMQVKE